MQDWKMYVEKAKAVRAFRTEKDGAPKGISAGDAVPGLIHYTPGDWIVEFEDGTRQAISDEAFKVTFSGIEDLLEEATDNVQPDTPEPNVDGVPGQPLPADDGDDEDPA